MPMNRRLVIALLMLIVIVALVLIYWQPTESGNNRLRSGMPESIQESHHTLRRSDAHDSQGKSEHPLIRETKNDPTGQKNNEAYESLLKQRFINLLPNGGTEIDLALPAPHVSAEIIMVVPKNESEAAASSIMPVVVVLNGDGEPDLRHPIVERRRQSRLGMNHPPMEQLDLIGIVITIDYFITATETISGGIRIRCDCDGFSTASTEVIRVVQPTIDLHARAYRRDAQGKAIPLTIVVNDSERLAGIVSWTVGLKENKAAASVPLEATLNGAYRSVEREDGSVMFLDETGSGFRFLSHVALLPADGSIVEFATVDGKGATRHGRAFLSIYD